MRTLAVIALLLATVASAADPLPGRPEVNVFIPVDPREHERLHYFDGQPHHLVPGTVTINGAPYHCDVDGKRFTDRDAFVAHLRSAHHVPPDRIPELLLVRDGRVHFVGE